MNYRHLYHAGNFADVVKHVVLVGLIDSLLRKETPFCFLDTHAGNGFYDLSSAAAKKNKEYQNGILKVLAQDQPPPLIERYLDCIRRMNSDEATLRYYPGSPFILRHFLRPLDRIIATELHPQEYRDLKQATGSNKQLAVHHLDGYQGLKAFLPPKEKRGGVLIDPPYENPDEFKQLSTALQMALKRWETGIYALWYPIKERLAIDYFHRHLRKTVDRPLLVLELSIYPEDVLGHLNGCGLLIINPPWQFDHEMNKIFAWLWKTLSVNQQGTFRVYFLPS